MEKNNEPFKGAVSVKKIANSIVVSNNKIKPTEDIYLPFTTIVARFSKSKYNKCAIDMLSDVDKYKLALADNENCQLYNKDDYSNMRNEHRPMEEFVLTYIINVPTTIINGNE